MRVTFQLGNTLQVFRLGTTTNKKISMPKVKIVQTYTYSIDQFEYVKSCLDNGLKTSFKDFFALDAANCFDCPFSSNSGTAKCYTHKFMQYSGFVSMLRSIVKEFGSLDNVPNYDDKTQRMLINIELAVMAKDRYVRFGSYGEPTMHPIVIVGMMSHVAKSYTGYTHQYVNKPQYNKWFMASTHNQLQANTASDKFGFRSFIAVKDNNNVQAVICPASNEGGFKTNCADCGLCSGVMGKTKKDIVILEH